ncbi:MAG: CPXCG motif-containing cysteine-rich protein [Gemmatimonadota bacterium]|nr:CPXCG motif-containing cysteine-rich protein [Gemmatimonadota bacterium]
MICPYCREPVTIALDTGGGAVQEYVEDCEVCCQPWQVSVMFRGGEASVSVRALNE